LTNDLKPIRILMVEDNYDDVEMIKEAFKEAMVYTDLSVVRDGVEAMAFLRQEGSYLQEPSPDFILLDLNLPKKNGHEVLTEIKNDDELRIIPVIILTSSQAKKDVSKAYSQHVNCYIAKPVDFEGLIKVIQSLKDFWFNIAKLPGR